MQEICVCDIKNDRGIFSIDLSWVRYRMRILTNHAAYFLAVPMLSYNEVLI